MPKTDSFPHLSRQLAKNECETSHPSNWIIDDKWQDVNKVYFKLFSHSVWVGFKYYREECNVSEFAETKPIGEMVLLLNDAFDVLNRRCNQDSIKSDKFYDKS